MPDLALALTGRARILDDLAPATALRAGGRGLHLHAHKALGHALLAGTVAAGAGLYLAVGAAGAMAGRAVLDSGGSDLLLGAEGSLLKGQLQPGHDVLAPARAVLGRPAAAAAAEEIAENISKAAEAAEVPRKAAAEAAAVGIKVGVHARKAVGIVPGALIRIGQHLVGLAHLLELLLGGLVAGVPVRVVLHGQLPVGLLYIIGTGAFVDAQHLVVITLIICHVFSPQNI